MLNNHSIIIKDNNVKMEIVSIATTKVTTINITPATIIMTNNDTIDDNNNDDLEGNVLDLRNDPEAHYRIVLFGYITPVFFLITLVANSLIVSVLSRPQMRSPTNRILLLMAVADLLTLLFPVPWYFYMYSLGYYKFLLHPAILCNLYRMMSEILPNLFHTISIWLTLLLACQRYIYICHPTMAKVWCTNQRVTRTILTIFLLASVHQLLRFFEGYWIDDSILQEPQDVTFKSSKLIFNQIDSENDNTNYLNSKNNKSTLMKINSDDKIAINDYDINQPSKQKACRQIILFWVKSIENLYFGSYFVFRVAFVHTLPCFFLILLNVLLYNTLKQVEKKRDKLLKKQNIPQKSIEQRNGSSSSTNVIVGTNTNKQRQGDRGRDANSTTFMLMVIVTIFLIVEIPLAIGTTIHVIENILGIDIVSDRFLSMTIIFSNFFIIISYPLNFAIYCGMSRAFRETFQQMFLNNTIVDRLMSIIRLLNPFTSNPTETTTTTTTIVASTAETSSSSAFTMIKITDNNSDNINNNNNTISQPKSIISSKTLNNCDEKSNNNNNNNNNFTKNKLINTNDNRISSNTNNNDNNNTNNVNNNNQIDDDDDDNNKPKETIV